MNGLNDALTVVAVDEPGSGGASHHYTISLPDWDRNPYGSGKYHVWDIQFQNGPIKEADFNGVSNEALLAVLIDRMRGFQGMAPVHETAMSKVAGDPAPYRCRENAIALTHLEEAMMWLQKRTRERLARGVEGTHEK